MEQQTKATKLVYRKTCLVDFDSICDCLELDTEEQDILKEFLFFTDCPENGEVIGFHLEVPSKKEFIELDRDKCKSDEKYFMNKLLSLFRDAGFEFEDISIQISW